MLYIRYFELASGKVVVSENIRTIADSSINKFLLAVQKNTARMLNRTSLTISAMPETFSKIAHLSWSKFRDKIDGHFDKKQELSKKKSDSAYWNSVSESRKK